KILNPKFFTIGFARRFAPYKRPSILFKDKERLARILKNPDRPVQIVCSGKAHPADFMGKNLIKEIIDFTYQYECEDRVIFIENYSLNIAQNLVQGVDIWLNTPIKPLEACGTSGMKAGINGVLNFSVLDGWWPECYDKNNGWAITAGEPYSNDALRDLADSNQIYDILEDEIIPLYYEQNENGIPEKWVWMMKQSIITTFKNFNIERMLKEYSDKFYKEISDSVNFLGMNNYENLKKISDEYGILKQFSNKIYIKEFFTDIDKYPILRSEDSISVEAYVYLDQLDPSFIEIEIFCLSEKLDGYITQKLDFVEKYKDNVTKYTGTFKLKNSGFQQIAIRIVPANKYIRKSFPDFIIWKA
ncbi:MAG TPA: alpha-glucan family phosphorylase, partial [Exilispira sp.]|nr:alpha-glucan family phosphorylase [Exilispira sp.]